MKALFGKDRVCGVAAGKTAPELIAQVRAGLRRTRTLELRLDYLASAAEREKFLAWIRRQRTRAVLIATCRRKEGGGLFAGSREKEIEILEQAAHSGCAWCDVEIETAGRMRRGELARRLAPARVLISHHDFKSTPRNLASIVRKLKASGGNAVKIAAQCASVSDSARV